MPMILQATNTHFYPGHRGTICGVQRIADLETERDAMVEFSDGSAASARIIDTPTDWRLQVDAYLTAAGTEIPAKNWLVRVHQEGDRLKFRILAKATGA